MTFLRPGKLGERGPRQTECGVHATLLYNNGVNLRCALAAFLVTALSTGLSARERVETLDIDARIEEENIQDPSEELADIQKRIDRRDLPKIQFALDRWEVRRESYPTLDLIADLMLRHPQVKLMIFAHTCILGSKEYNLWLSEKRAKSVKEQLAKRGVPPPSIRFRGRGFSEPAADNSTEEGREKNRRVEFRLLRRWWSAVY